MYALVELSQVTVRAVILADYYLSACIPSSTTTTTTTTTTTVTAAVKSRCFIYARYSYRDCPATA